MPYFCVIARGEDLTEGRMRLVGAGIATPPDEEIVARWVAGGSATDARAKVEAILGDGFEVTNVVREEVGR